MVTPTPEEIAQLKAQVAAEAARRGMTPEQFTALQRQQLFADAARQGMSPEQYIEQLKVRALEAHRAQQAAAQGGQAGGGQAQEQGQGAGPGQGKGEQRVPVFADKQPEPQALALAAFLRGQDLKPRTCVLDGRRREMFKVKRAIRALESPAYKKAQARNALLPPVTDTASAVQAFKQLPLSLLALRVTKVDDPAGEKHVKGLWTVRIEPQQEAAPLTHYVWLYDGPQWKQKAGAAAVLAGIMAVVMFPLWPMVLRRGVWYASIGMLGLLGLFFAMAIVRLVLFCVTVVVTPPGLWLYPNLFEDVGFFDSFRPLWGWQETKESRKAAREAKKAATEARRARRAGRAQAGGK